jgi:hypothetical protein
VNWKNLSTFIVNCFRCNLNRDTYKILKLLINEFKTLNGLSFHETLLPFLHRVATAWTKSALSDNAAYQKSFQDTLHLYIVRYVQPEPEAPEIVRPPIQCSLPSTCKNCTSINAFLQHPTQTQSPEYRIAIAEYEHVNTALRTLLRADVDVIVINRSVWKFVYMNKTTQQFTDKLAVWKSKREHTQEALCLFGDEVLIKVLGDRYDEIANMRCVRLEPKGR